MAMTGGVDQLDDLAVASELMATCYELYRRSPAGLAPEIAFFVPSRPPHPKAHLADVGGGDFHIKSQVERCPPPPPTWGSVCPICSFEGRRPRTDKKQDTVGPVWLAR
jgi:hypothetical protein